MNNSVPKGGYKVRIVAGIIKMGPIAELSRWVCYIQEVGYNCLVSASIFRLLILEYLVNLFRVEEILDSNVRFKHLFFLLLLILDFFDLIRTSQLVICFLEGT